MMYETQATLMRNRRARARKDGTIQNTYAPSSVASPALACFDLAETTLCPNGCLSLSHDFRTLCLRTKIGAMMAPVSEP